VSGIRILPVPYYDMIIGMDWLEVHSPMRIERKNKWISITHDGALILLHGLQPSLPELSVIEACLLVNRLMMQNFLALLKVICQPRFSNCWTLLSICSLNQPHFHLAGLVIIPFL
jgi:hypothetical protein